MKNIRVFFLSENFQFLEVKFSIYLNRRVFVMAFFFKDCSNKGDTAERRGVSLTGSSVEDQISEIIIFKFLLHIPVARCLNHSRKKNFCFWLVITFR